jgi:pyruvate dehydrogenase E2 component (dihydrolipoamide acetyltransferase)
MSDAEIVMPRLSDTMEEGTILRWLIADGAHVKRGEQLVEIETDKASMTYDADVEGTLQIVAREGDSVAVGAPIAHVGQPASTPVDPTNANAGDSGAEQPSASAPLTESNEQSPPAPIPMPTEGSTPVRVAPGSPSSNGAGAGRRVLATPLARRASRLHGIALEQLAGSGPRGRIVQSDVLTAAGVASAQPSAAPRVVRATSGGPRVAGGVTATGSDTSPAVSNGSIKGATRHVAATRTQQLVARRMAEAKATIPDFQVQAEVAMDRAIAFRAELRAILEVGAPSLNDLIVKACAIALRWHPRANASYVDGGFDEHEHVNVGVAVAGEQTLVVPVVQDADKKALAQIARETRRLAERVRTGAISPPELSGGTFTVSNLGMYGMTQIVPVINPPQAAILGVGAIRETLARVDGEVVERRLMTLTLSCDHRILYGADASLFLADVKALLEAPLRLAL